MRAKCPKCQTSYALKPLSAKGTDSVIICAVCQTHLDVKCPSWKTLFRYKVTVRQNPEVE
jgi:phage FluMu protein Com